MSQFINKNTVNSGDKIGLEGLEGLIYSLNHTFNLSLRQIKKEETDKNERFGGKYMDSNTTNNKPLWSFGSFQLIVISTHDFTYNIQAQHTHKPLQLYRYQTQYVDYLWSEQHICSEMKILLLNRGDII